MNARATSSKKDYRGARTILVDALSARAGGGIAVARSLPAAIARSRRDWQIVVLGSDDRIENSMDSDNVRFVRIPRAARPIGRFLIEQFGLEEYLPSGGVDAALLLGGFGPIACRAPQISVWQNAHIWSPPAPGQNRKLRLYIAAQKWMMRASVQRVDINVFLSADSLARCREHMRVGVDNAVVTPLGLDDQWMSPPIPEEADRQPLLLCVGDLYEHKRVEVAVEALRILADRFPRLRLSVAGRTIDSGYEHRLRDLAARGGVADRVDFLGSVDRESLRRLYRTSWVLVSMSRLESFGLTPLEAMASGLPVIATSESATPEVCGDAALYSEAHPVCLSEAIARLIEDEQEWSQLADQGRCRVANFSWDSVAERYAELIDSIA